MTYTHSKLLSFEEFWSQYGDDSRYELATFKLAPRMTPASLPVKPFVSGGSSMAAIIQGVTFESVEMVRDVMAKAKTQTGLKVFVSILDQVISDRP